MRKNIILLLLSWLPAAVKGEIISISNNIIILRGTDRCGERHKDEQKSNGCLCTRQEISGEKKINK